MLDYLIKYNLLPADLRAKISSPKVMAAINELETQYQVDLATVIMRIMVRELALGGLAQFFINESKLESVKAEGLVVDIKAKVLNEVMDYLEPKVQQQPVKTPEPEKKLEQAPEKPREETKRQPITDQAQHALAKSGSHLPATRNKSEEEKEIEEVVEEFRHPLQQANKPLAPVQTNGSNFYFDAEDEEEIKKLAEAAPAQSTESDELEQKLSKILKEIQINFSSQLLIDRLKQILTTYLRGIRSRVDTKLTLAKSISAGGLELDEETSERVVSVTESVKNNTPLEKVIAPKKITLPEDQINADKLASLKTLGARDVEYDLAKEIKNRENKTVPPENIVPEPPKETPLSEIIKKAEEVARQMPANPESAAEKIQIRRPVEIGNKIRMDDVKAVPKTMGPVDELRYLDLVSFRRLDHDPSKAVLKIKEKINFLRSEQFSQGIEAVKAWRVSPVNKLYLSIGEQAINNGKSVEDIIGEKQAANEEYLNSSEFEAIMSLNKELRY